MEDVQGQLKKFRDSRQEPVRLKLALEAYRLAEFLPLEVREEYRRYLKRRRRPAAEAQIRQGDLPGLKLLWQDGILGKEDWAACLEKAQEAGEAEIAAWLLGMEPMASPEGVSAGAQALSSGEEGRWLPAPTFGEAGRRLPAPSLSEAGRRILALVRRRLQLRMPAFALAFGVLPSQAEESLDRCLGTDGEKVYFQPRRLRQQFLDGGKTLERTYLHLCLHAVSLHMLPDRGIRPALWEAACDWTVEYQAARLMGAWEAGGAAEVPGGPVENPAEEGPGGPVENLAAARSRWFRQLEALGRPVRAEAAYRWLVGHPEAAETLEALFRRDAHPWQWGGEAAGAEKDGAGKTGAGKTGEGKDRAWQAEALARKAEIARRWNQIRRSVQEAAAVRSGRRGSQGGNGWEAVALRKKKVFDYRRFLQRYAVFREERQLDLDSFDYLPYLYSLEHYEKLLLLEPLEYAEVHRLEELVIAIDTSGSCSGPVVRQFLEETYQILSGTGNFFRRMQVAVVQCDSMIQDCAILHSREEWEAYAKNLKIQGLGGTDFRPVFRLVEEMRAKGQLRNLKGLLYFTDGDGIYPQRKPPYETAFVFLNDAYEKHPAPDWAVTLNLRLKLADEAPAEGRPEGGGRGRP